MKVCKLLIFSFLISLNLWSQSKNVIISTNFGDIKIVLYDDTPNHRDSFIKLAQEGHYDGTLFYRVIKNFVIQGGTNWLGEID